MKIDEEFNDREIVKELKTINNKLESIFELLTDYINMSTAKPEVILTKEKAEKDFSDLKDKLASMNKIDKHRD